MGSSRSLLAPVRQLVVFVPSLPKIPHSLQRRISHLCDPPCFFFSFLPISPFPRIRISRAALALHRVLVTVALLSSWSVNREWRARFEHDFSDPLACVMAISLWSGAVGSVNSLAGGLGGGVVDYLGREAESTGVKKKVVGREVGQRGTRRGQGSEKTSCYLPDQVRPQQQCPGRVTDTRRKAKGRWEGQQGASSRPVIGHWRYFCRSWAARAG